jgi:FtsH-binding integral membrane protein
VTPHDLTSFYEASAGVAGALIGLLFVAVSVHQTRTAETGSTAPQRISAAAALTAFTNALATSLFTLIEGQDSGTPALAVAITGLVFVITSLLSLRSDPRRLREVLFLVTLLVAFIAQLITALHVSAHPTDVSAQRTLAILVVVFFLIGIARSWVLVEGPSFGLGHQLAELARARRTRDGRSESPTPAGESPRDPA